MTSFCFSSVSKRPGATLAGIFSLALSSVLLLCGAGLTPTGNVQTSDINANGHCLTNAATVCATNLFASVVQATNSVTTGTVTTGTLTVTSSAALPGGTTVGGGTPLLAANNLSDVGSAATAQSNLGLGTAATLTFDTDGTLSADDNLHLPTDAAVVTYVGAHSGLTLGTNTTAAGFTFSSGTLELSAVVNQDGGLTQISNDGSIAWMPGATTDTYSGSIAIGNSASATHGGYALGQYASSSYGGVALGEGANSSTGGGVAAGAGCSSTALGAAVGVNCYATYGGAVGCEASESGGGAAVGSGASATTGVALGVRQSDGSPTSETGGGANFCGGNYSGTGIAINAHEVADVNGDLTGLIPSSAPSSSSAAGVAGQFAYGSGYVYICVATNTWKRAALSSW